MEQRASAKTHLLQASGPASEHFDMPMVQMRFTSSRSVKSAYLYNDNFDSGTSADEGE